MPQHPPALPPDITVLERGWLSANNIVFGGRHGTAVVDTGYCSHADQTVALVQGALHGCTFAVAGLGRKHDVVGRQPAALQHRDIGRQRRWVLRHLL